MQRLLPLLAAGALAALTTAQQSIVIPNGTATTEGNSSNAFPWGRGGTGMLFQGIYDASNFTLQGVNYPIIIQGLRWRPNTNVALVASSYTAGCSVSLSTAAFGTGVAPSTTMASNRGANLQSCFSGVVSWNAQPAQVGPTPFGISIPFTNNFLYNPAQGDLNIECDLPIQTFTGTGPQLDVQTTGSLSSRVYISTGYPGTGIGTVGTVHGVVVEVIFNPAAGLYAGFTSNVTAGPVPTTVNFTDTTFTSAPGGVTSWAWDLNGDNVTDSTLQNPSFTYTACGAYNVRLTATDGTHPASTVTKTGYIQIGITPIVPSYTSAPLAPGVYQFTDTSTPTPASWAWDFNGDMIVDSTAQNPVWAYAPCTTSASVTLSVSSTCAGPWSTTGTLVLLPPIVPSFTFAALGGGVFQFTDTSTPTPATWAWDLNGDMVTDSTAQNPVWAYTAPCTAVSVGLTVTSACAGPWTLRKALIQAPTSMTTTLAPNNGAGNAPTGGCLFNINVTNPKGVNICGLTLTPYNVLAGNQLTCAVWITDAPGGYVGNNTNAAVWRQVGSGAGADTGVLNGPMDFALNAPVYVPFGTYGMAITTSQGLRYRTEPTNPTVYVGADFTITTGIGTGALFGTVANQPRGICGTFHYSTLTMGAAAGYGFAGSGCPGTMPVTTLTANHPPTLGNTMSVALNNLPNSVALMMNGFSRTTSILGPLPLAGAPYGAPGCNLRVSPDANVLLIGAANAATWSLTVPGGVGLIGLLLHQQAIVFNPGFNGAGAVISDAGSMMIGN